VPGGESPVSHSKGAMGMVGAGASARKETNGRSGAKKTSATVTGTLIAPQHFPLQDPEAGTFEGCLFSQHECRKGPPVSDVIAQWFVARSHDNINTAATGARTMCFFNRILNQGSAPRIKCKKEKRRFDLSLLIGGNDFDAVSEGVSRS